MASDWPIIAPVDCASLYIMLKIDRTLCLGLAQFAIYGERLFRNAAMCESSQDACSSRLTQSLSEIGISLKLA
jgi:hypothetical protein